MISLISSGGLILSDAKNEFFRYFYPENDRFLQIQFLHLRIRMQNLQLIKTTTKLSP